MPLNYDPSEFFSTQMSCQKIRDTNVTFLHHISLNNLDTDLVIKNDYTGHSMYLKVTLLVLQVTRL